MDEPWEGPRWTADTETIFGMMLLLETGRSFFHINDVQNDTNLHDTAVRLAEEVQDNLNRLIEGELAAGQFSNMQPRTVRALERKQAELGVYIKSAGTSLYHQLPWTAGAQMGETLYSALDLGFIIAPKLSTPIHLLEQLCDFFKEQVFLGDRPTRKFTRSLKRFMGGKLETKTDFASNSGDARKSQYQISMPQSVKYGQADNDRIKPAEFCLFHNLRASKPAFHAGPALWAKLFTNNRIKSLTAKQTLAIDRELRDAPFAATLERVKEAATSEFEGSFPIATVNWFKVYELMVSILTDVAERYQREMPADMEPFQKHFESTPANASVGSSFVLILLQVIDCNVESSRRWDDNKSEGVKMTWEAFERCAGAIEIEDLLWENA
ncbi:unnamed protein product [Zymoseptoria tritici ST99CH_3D7]|uniref:Uncharacterized protein n=2 Tax=Zymoseptoria tritici TaxID=1047171 RepID=A0A1X7RXK4_ZYMT9|nr:unnamed protein product [Zymoseptoria tritici ST99CH_3D7]SMR54972.1 unnamed protein product [Zymoseptoria tritici ST99CH_1E4]